ncbi:hypothetical protein [Sinorhizobium medicae]|uniref:hypothetical protein n=1 Tax=Sinorhizobium medicae TaxID=110321 RepID=UPI0011A011F5|nr:hypothetical protein [Sinorhizobium medicae]TWA24753.1 hypothetical protein FB007_14115 [Sinorhizobium medicae]
MAGIFVLEGMTVRIPKFSLSLDEQGNLSTDGIRLEVAYDACIAWARIALIHRIEALRCMETRRAIWADETQDGDAKARSLVEEFRASVQAVVASAICADALYDHLNPLSGVPLDVRAAWVKKKTARHAQVAETIRAACNVKPHEATKLKDFLKHLFKLRDAAVHPTNTPRQPYPHPDLDVSTDWTFVTFRGDLADVVVCTAVGLLWDVTRGSKYKSPELTQFMDDFRKRVEDLLPDGRPVPHVEEVTAFSPPSREMRGPEQL